MLDVADEHLQRGERERDPVTRCARIDPDRHREQETFETHGLAEQRQHDQHDEVAGELQRERRRDGRVDDELVRERDLADQPAVAGAATSRAASPSCAASHGQSATATNSRKLRPSNAPARNTVVNTK